MIDSINQVDSQSALRIACLENPKRCKKLLAFELIKLLATTPLSQRLPGYINYSSFSEPSPKSHTQPTPEPVVGWQQVFDDTYWVPFGGNGTWNDSLQRWEHTGNKVYLTPIGTWSAGYRPTKIRLTHDGIPTCRLFIEDPSEDYIVFQFNYVSEFEHDLNFGSELPGDDLFKVFALQNLENITNIEFYSLPI